MVHPDVNGTCDRLADPRLIGDPAVTCGPQAKIYCFRCGDYVQHQIFEQEKERLDLIGTFPWMGWREHPVQRSFDALRFMRVLDQGIVWRGMTATYPPLVPWKHVVASRICQWRHSLFHGKSSDFPEGLRRELALHPRPIGLYKASQLSFKLKPFQSSTVASSVERTDSWIIPTPVGMYNLGNTCFMNAFLQCLVHCRPVQKYFLNNTGHNHLACLCYRTELNGEGDVCLACELDKLMLRYFDSSTGAHVSSLVAERSFRGFSATTENSENHFPSEKGEPLVTADMLSAAWNCGGMKHLAGYEQRDAHEFLHAFLETLGKHTKQYRDRVYNAINVPRPANAVVGDPNIMEQGTLYGRLYSASGLSVTNVLW